MKVSRKFVLALSLAVPLNLVSADELLVKLSYPSAANGDHSYTGPEQIRPLMRFEDVTVVPPSLDIQVVAPAEPGVEESVGRVGDEGVAVYP